MSQARRGRVLPRNISRKRVEISVIWRVNWHHGIFWTMLHQRWFWLNPTEHACNTWCVQINCTSLFLLSQDIESNGEQYEDNPTWAQLSRLNRRHFLKERRLTGDKLQTLATLKLIFYCRFKYQDLYFSRQHQELKKINYVFNEDIFNHFKGEPVTVTSP